MTKMRIVLKNSTVDLPNDVGNYILSTGCGSGKTYWLERFTRMHYWEGFLIVVDSIVSANTLYSHLINLGIDSSDIMMIHSQTDYEVQNEYANNPQEVTTKKIVIMTNIRLYTEYPPVYLLYNKNGVVLSPFDGNWGTLMNHPYARRWIIIDEIPGFIQKYATISKPHLGILGEDDGYGVYKPKDTMMMKNAYNSFIANTDLAFFDAATVLGKLRTDTALYIIRNNYTDMLKKHYDAHIQFSPCDFQTGRSLVLIMEGAGDILFKNSSIYQVIDVPKKYKAKACFHSFNIPNIKRRSNNQQDVVKSMVEAVVNILASVNGKTLITCWNDLKSEDVNAKDEVKNSNDSPLASALSEELSKTMIPKDSYSIIYYGSTESKAVNTYRDYTNIILLGKWTLPILASSDKFNKAFQTNTTHTRYMLWEYVQLITRIAIRQDKDIEVYYTDDHNQNFISTLEKYFNQNTLEIPEEQIDWRDKVEKIKNRKSVISQIEKLVQRFPYISEMIIDGGKNKTITIRLKELNQLIGIKKKKRDYRHLITVLQKFGVCLNIQ